MPAKSVAQQQAAGAALRAIREGRTPRAFKGASVEQIRHFARTKHRGLKGRAARRRKIAEMRAHR